jgi:hypothetical protein
LATSAAEAAIANMAITVAINDFILVSFGLM